MNSYRINKFRQKKQEKTSKKVSFLFYINCIMAGATIMLAGFYFVQVNAHASQGFALLDIEKEIAELETRNHQLNVQVIQYTSMNSIKERLEGKDFIANTDVEFMRVNAGVAIK